MTIAIFTGPAPAFCWKWFNATMGVVTLAAEINSLLGVSAPYLGGLLRGEKRRAIVPETEC